MAATKKAKKKRQVLTAKQRAFVEHYLIERDGTAAAIKAGYSPRSARVYASILLAKPHVRAAVEAGIVRISEKAEVTAERVLKEEARIAFFDPRCLFTEKNTLKPINALDSDQAAAVAGIEVIEIPGGGVKTKVRLCSKGASLERLGKYLGLYNKVQHTGEDGGPIQVEHKMSAALKEKLDEVYRQE